MRISHRLFSCPKKFSFAALLLWNTTRFPGTQQQSLIALLGGVLITKQGLYYTRATIWLPEIIMNFREKLEKERQKPSGKQGFIEFMYDYLKLAKHNLSPTTHVHYKKMVDGRIKRFFEPLKLKIDKKVLEELFAERMKKYPDALTYDDIARITGRARKFVYKWVLDGRIKSVPLNERINIVPKQWLLDYMLTDDFIYNYASCNRLKPILNQAVIER